MGASAVDHSVLNHLCLLGSRDGLQKVAPAVDHSVINHYWHCLRRYGWGAADGDYGESIDINPKFYLRSSFSERTKPIHMRAGASQT